MNKFNQMVTAYANGIKYPYQTMKAADESGVPFHVLCAFLEQESSGGQNIFGHDPTIFAGAGRVTKKKYLAYKKQRDLNPKRRQMQGVGPMQLTWWEYQDHADEMGGCWKPGVNILKGALILSDHWDQMHDWVLVGEKYNGRLSYGYEVKDKIVKWKSLLT